MTTKNVRLRDVAEAAGTSTKTASRVINGDPRVSAATRRRVEEAVATLGYQVDLMARSLRRGVDDTIGIIVPTIGDPFFAGMLDEIERIAMTRDFKVLVANNSRSPEVERKVVEGLLARRVAGLIVTPNNADYAFLSTVRTPVVFLDRHPAGLEAGCVRVDDRGEAAVITADHQQVDAATGHQGGDVGGHLAHKAGAVAILGRQQADGLVVDHGAVVGLGVPVEPMQRTAQVGLIQGAGQERRQVGAGQGSAGCINVIQVSEPADETGIQEGDGAGGYFEGGGVGLRVHR